MERYIKWGLGMQIDILDRLKLNRVILKKGTYIDRFLFVLKEKSNLTKFYN